MKIAAEHQEGMGIFNQCLVLIALVELVAVRIIGFPLAASPSVTRVMFSIGDFAHWIGLVGIGVALIFALLRQNREQLHLPISFPILIGLLILASIIHLIFRKTLWIETTFCAVTVWTIFALFNLTRRNIERQNHFVIYLFAAPLLFRFLFLLLESIQQMGVFQLPEEVYSYLQYVDEILLLIALLGVGFVFYERVTFGWKLKKSLTLIFSLILFGGFLFAMGVYPWSTLAVLQELGFKLFTYSRILSILIYGIPLFCGITTILLLGTMEKTKNTSVGLLLILLSSHTLSHTTLFYQLLSILGLIYLLLEGATKPKYILSKRKKFF